MSRQHDAPVLAPSGGLATTLTPPGLSSEGHGWREAAIQQLIPSYPACLPISAIRRGMS